MHCLCRISWLGYPESNQYGNKKLDHEDTAFEGLRSFSILPAGPAHGVRKEGCYCWFKRGSARDRGAIPGSSLRGQRLKPRGTSCTGVELLCKQSNSDADKNGREPASPVHVFMQKELCGEGIAYKRKRSTGRRVQCSLERPRLGGSE